jgi:hypothetical protein
MKPAIELYLLSVRMLTAADAVGLPENGFKKAIRSFESWAKEQSEVVEGLDSEVHARVVHNFNVIIDSIDHDTLSLPIGELTVEK